MHYQVASFYGGTGLLIAVSVAFDLVQKIDSHLVMRNYRGLLEKCEARRSAAACSSADRSCCRGGDHMRIIFIGPPGVGKGTQSQAAGRVPGAFRTSRPATCCGRRLARRPSSACSRSNTWPRQAGSRPAHPAIGRAPARPARLPDGCLLDGFPRTLGQAEALDEFLQQRGTPLDGVLELKVDTDEIVKRLAGRGRDDDRPEIVRQRLDAVCYGRPRRCSTTTAQRGLLQRSTARGTPDEVFERIKTCSNKWHRPVESSMT